jgi:predicted neutral ceramidase superfamily lipid hydrolase
MLPFEIQGWLLLALSFVMGFSIDIFSNTQGMHAAASVLMAYCRPWIIRLVASPREAEAGIQPCIRDMGFSWFLSYSLILILLHHTLLFYMEAFTFRQFWITLVRVLMSTLFTTGLVILSQYLFFMKKR